MNEQTQKRNKINSKRLKRKKRESPTHPLDRKQAEFEFELMWPSICEAVLPNSLIQWISTWRCGVPAETPAPHPVQTRWSSDWAVPAVCSKLHQRDRTPHKTPTPPLTLFSLSHVAFTSASSHLNCTGSSLKGAVGARSRPDLRRIILTWITVETPTLYAWDDCVYRQLPPTEKTRRTAVWPERKACKWGCDFLTSVGLMLSLH